jgi:hypothetical protein
VEQRSYMPALQSEDLELSLISTISYNWRASADEVLINPNFKRVRSLLHAISMQHIA